LSSNCFIVVFDKQTGIIKTARSYSAGGYNNYNYLVRSILVSSAPSSMAFILSNYKTSSTSASCTGQLLFKFDPVNFSTAPVWIK